MKKEDIIKLRDYFKEHDKTPFEHWAYTFLNNQLATDGQEELEKFVADVARGQNGELKGSFIIRIMNQAKKLLNDEQRRKMEGYK